MVPGPGHHVEVGIVVERLGIDSLGDEWMRSYRVQVGGKHENTTLHSIDEASDSDAIDRQQRLAALGVDQRE